MQTCWTEHQDTDAVLASGEARKDCAQRWAETWCARLLSTTAKVMEMKQTRGGDRPLHAACPENGQGETLPGEAEQTTGGDASPETGEVTGQRFDYVYFEEASGSLSRELRSALAKLRVPLGYVTNTKLNRMLLLNGAKDRILKAVSDLPDSGPSDPCSQGVVRQAPKFNERILSDVLFVWGSNCEKHAVARVIDAFR